jgi:hypothetical protein
MNPAQAKIASWALATVTGAALCIHVFASIKTHADQARNVSTEEMTTRLTATPEIVKGGADSKVAYDDVRAALIDYKWNAPPPPTQAERAAKAPEPEPVASTIDKLVKVLGYSVDGDDPAGGKAILKYLPEARVPPPKLEPGQIARDGVLKYVGDRLDSPISHIRVVAVTPDGVEFAYDDERPNEVLTPAEYDLSTRMSYVDAADLKERRPEFNIPVARGQSIPTETTALGRNRFRLGTEDMQTIGEDFSRILSEEVHTRRHRDPNTGRYDGIEITSVAEGSIASRHGARSGDVIKSINGHPVTSPPEAIAFVKNNQDMYDKWEVVVSNLGQERTVTYFSPEK